MLLAEEDSHLWEADNERWDFIAEETVDLLMGRKGSGPMWVRLDPDLVSASARSLPSMSECPGTQWRARELQFAAARVFFYFFFFSFFFFFLFFFLYFFFFAAHCAKDSARIVATPM